MAKNTPDKTPERPADLLPTPPVGWRVLWRREGGRHIVPADVIENSISEPGIITLSINFGTQLKLMEAVHWSGHPGAQNITTANVRFRGTWDYLPDVPVPDSHYDVHLQLEELREQNLQQQQEYLAKMHAEAAEAAKQEIDPRAVAVASVQAQMILNESMAQAAG
jgi:hypothetical protein